ncbi:MAG: hypothetical protein QOE52_2539 [Mycobacterium sp.]|jgi:hypothetical protein|nr:hypothetical protein [Mycobacterium sp.]
MALATLFSHSTPGHTDPRRKPSRSQPLVKGHRYAACDLESVLGDHGCRPRSRAEFNKLVWGPSEGEGLVLQNDSWVGCGG